MFLGKANQPKMAVITIKVVTVKLFSILTGFHVMPLQKACTSDFCNHDFSTKK